MIEQVKTPESALATALEINSAVNIDMGRYNLPGFAAKWAAGRTVYALQSFIQHALQYLYYRGTSGEWKDQKAILRLLFVMGLIGGFRRHCRVVMNWTRSCGGFWLFAKAGTEGLEQPQGQGVRQCRRDAGWLCLAGRSRSSNAVGGWGLADWQCAVPHADGFQSHCR